MNSQRLIAPALFTTAIGGNYLLHKAGLPTMCDDTRVTLHTESLAGKIAFAGGWAALTTFMLPHIIAPRNQHHLRSRNV